MSIQLAVSTRNAQLDAIENDVGTSARLQLRTGSPPADCATANSGTVVADMTLPSDWMANASAGSKAKSGTWQDSSADNSGTIGHFRIYDSTATTCKMQGTVTVTGGGGDMTVDNPVVLANQQITVTSFTLTAGNA